jgi:hypothetical protein
VNIGLGASPPGPRGSISPHRESHNAPLDEAGYQKLKAAVRTLGVVTAMLADRRGWTIAIEVKEFGSGASVRELRQKLLDAARRRDIDVVAGE